MSRKQVDQGPDLFAWGDAQPVPPVVAELKNLPSDDRASAPVEPAPVAAPVTAAKPKRSRIAAPVVEPVIKEPAPVVDFLAKRPTLPRWILGGRRDLQAFDRWLARREGTMPPAPILPLARRPPPADPGDDDAPQRRAG